MISAHGRTDLPERHVRMAPNRPIPLPRCNFPRATLHWSGGAQCTCFVSTTTSQICMTRRAVRSRLHVHGTRHAHLAACLPTRSAAPTRGSQHEDLDRGNVLSAICTLDFDEDVAYGMDDMSRMQPAADELVHPQRWSTGASRVSVHRCGCSVVQDQSV